MNRGKFEMYWSYYCSLENMLQKTNQYVAHADDNKLSFSDEFTKIVLLASSEIDSILELLCQLKHIQKSKKYYSMIDYAQALNKTLPNAKNIFYQGSLSFATHAETMEYNSGIIVEPFATLDLSKIHAGLEWWCDYQKLKHNRLESAKKGNLFNAISTVAALYILIRVLSDFLPRESGHDYIKENYVSKFLIPVI